MTDQPQRDEPGHPAPGYRGYQPEYLSGAQPPPGYPQPAMPGPVPPPKKSNRGAWTIVLIVVGSLLALCCVGGGVAGFFVYRGVKQIGPAVDATKAFIADLESRDASAAYDKLCSQTKASFPEPVFATIVESEPAITDYDITSSNIQNVNGRTSARVVATLDRASGARDPHTFVLSREGGKWLVCGQPY